MKTISIVLSFAALVATGLAQSPAPKPTPSQEIAPLVAVEEQEGDLAKAERLYREAIAGTTLSAAAKQLATARLIDLLGKLGKVEERKQWIDKLDGGAPMAFDNITESSPQDRERQAALRTKARELVQKVLAQSSVPYPAATGISDAQLRSQLLWLGPAAIPEIAAALASETRLFEAAKADNQAPAAFSNQVRQAPAALVASMQLRREAVAGLAGVIWELGGEAGESHLDALFAKVDAPFRCALVQFAWQAREPRMLRLAERWLQKEQDDEVADGLLAASGPERRVGRWIVATVGAGHGPRHAGRALPAPAGQSVGDLQDEPKAVGRLHRQVARVRTTNPLWHGAGSRANGPVVPGFDRVASDAPRRRDVVGATAGAVRGVVGDGRGNSERMARPSHRAH